VLEPQLSGHLNVTRYFRLGSDLGYRFVAAPTVVDGPDSAGSTAAFTCSSDGFDLTACAASRWRPSVQ
jgi:hypothetical protein